MPVTLSCPQSTCRQPLCIADGLLGRSVRCPHCNQVFQAVAPPAPSVPAVTATAAPLGLDSRPREPSKPSANVSPQATWSLSPAESSQPSTRPTSTPAATLSVAGLPSSPPQETLDLVGAAPSVPVRDRPFDLPPPSGSMLAVESLPRIGRFEIRTALGEGAFGRVYRAHDPQLDREIALKVAKPEQMNTPQRIERFLREAKAAAQLRHPHIVPVYDAGQDGSHYYIAAAFIEGQTLEAAIDHSRLNFQQAAQIVRHLAEALAYAHALGIVHRDVKPANVMLDAKGQPLLMDFGLAARKEGAEKLTQAGAILGTPLYMAPEQAKGQTGDPLPASDQYSLGVMLYELLCGQTPFVGPPEVVIINHLQVEPKSPRRVDRRVPRDLETICLKCLEKEPTKRYADCQALADDLRRWLDGEPIRARRLHWTERTWRWTRRNPALAGSLAAVFVLLLAGVVGTTAALVNITEARNNEHAARTDAEKTAGENLQLAGRLKGSLDDVRSALNAKNDALIAKNAEYQRARYSAYVTQLYRARELHERHPLQALELLHDCNNCPIDLRDPVWHYFENYCRRWQGASLTSSIVLKGTATIHDVKSIAFSTDGRTFATGSDDKTVKLWDAISGSERATLRGHMGPVNAVSITNDGQTLASASDDGTVKLWDVPSSQERATLKVGVSVGGRAASVAFSHDGRTLASGSWDGLVKLWDVSTRRERATLKGHKSPVTSVAFSRDGRTLASASNGTSAITPSGEKIGGGPEMVMVWDVDSRQERATLNGSATVAFSSDNRTLAYATTDNTLKLWDVATQTVRATLKGHTGWIYSVAFSNDGGSLASASKDSVKLWEVASGQERVSLRPPEGGVNSVAFSNDDRTLASACNGGIVKLWNLQTTYESATLVGHRYAVQAVAFSNDGRSLASAGGLAKTPGEIKLWDVMSRKERYTLKGHPQGVNSVAFSSDGKTLASVSHDKAIKLWDIRSSQERATLTGHQDSIYSVLFSSDGATLASASYTTVKVWDLANGRERATLKSNGPGIAFSKDGRTLAYNGPSGTVLWDIPTGQQRTVFNGITLKATDGRTLACYRGRDVLFWDLATGQERATLKASRNLQNLRMPVAFSSDGRTLASGSVNREDWSVKLWDVASGEERATLKSHTGPVHSVAFSDGSMFASGSMDGTVKLWDLASGPRYATLRGHNSKVVAVTFSAAAGLLASSSASYQGKLDDKAQGEIKLWSLRTGQEVGGFKTETGAVSCLKFNHSGRILASDAGLSRQPGAINLWDLDDRQDQPSLKLRATLQGHSNRISSMAFSSDGRTLATVGRDQTVKLWDLASGKERATLRGQMGSLSAVAFSGDDLTVAYASVDQIKLWNPVNGQQRANLMGHTNQIATVTFSNDGRTLASAGYDNTVKLWEVSSGKEIATLQGHTRRILAVAFSGDGLTLASGGHDGKVKLWDVASRKELATLEGPGLDGADVSYLAFSSDDRTLAVGSDNKTVWLWDLKVLKGNSLDQSANPRK